MPTPSSRQTATFDAGDERFRLIFQEASDPILILSKRGEILAANPAFERITGLESNRLFCGDKTWEDFVHREDCDELHACMEKLLKEQEDQVVELRAQNLAGQSLWLKWSFSILHKEQPSAAHIMAVGRDIGKHNQRERRLRRKVRVMERRNVRAQVLIAKLKQFFTRVNSLPANMDGYLGGVCDILFEMYRPLLVQIIAKGAEETRIYQAGNIASRPSRDDTPPTMMCENIMESGVPLYCDKLQETEPYNGDPLVQELGLNTYLGAPLRDSAGNIRGTISLLDKESRVFDSLDVELITVAALQVASRLRAEQQEEEKRGLEEHLRQAQKMKAVGTLAGGIAHDFNNILSGILGFASFLMSKVEPDSDMHRNLALIEQSAVRASELTEQLVAFARRKHFTKEPVNLNRIVEEVAELLKPSISKNTVIEYRLAMNLASVLGDHGQLHQVLMNLCMNASEAMGSDGGTLRILTETRPLTPHEKRLLVNVSDGEYVCVVVSDTGMGMSPEVQEHIFDPFYTTKSKEGGTGLGLSVVYGIVTNHGGDITVESEEGSGTTFTLYFPASSERGAETNEEKESRPVRRGTETVLVVDDEAIVRQMVTEVLKGHGYTVVPADSGEEALELYRELQEKIDLVLLDIVMPGMDGEETLKELQKINPDITVLLTSGYANSEKSARLLKMGTKGLVHKPYKSKVLLESIRKVIDE